MGQAGCVTSRQPSQSHGGELARADQARRKAARLFPAPRRFDAHDPRSCTGADAQVRQRDRAIAAGRQIVPKQLHGPDLQGRTEQYFEILSNRSIYYADGWKANAQHTLPWRQDLAPGNWENDKWELYNLSEDFSEANDLAAKMPEKIAELKAKFDADAAKYHVYPLDDRGAARLAIPKPPPPGADPKATMFTFYPGAVRLAENAAPPMKNRSWTLTANITGNGAKTQGAILGFGGVAAGISAYLKDGVPVFDYNYFEKHTIVKGNKSLPIGNVTLQFEFAYAGGGLGKAADLVIKMNGEEVGRGHCEQTVAGRFGIDTFGIGEDTGQPVTDAYKPPFKFNGEIEKVTISVK